jgi:hypothetical protein
MPRKGAIRQCPVCGRQIAVYPSAERFWNHLTPDGEKRCEGSGRRVALW